MSPVLYTPDGAVAVPSEQAALLASVSPRLSLQWHAGCRCFVVALAWSPDDPRHEQDPAAREEGRAWSIECMIPPDVRVDEMASWALRKMQRTDGEGRRMADAYFAASMVHNETHGQRIGEQVLDEVLETVDVDAPTIQPGRRRTRVR